MKVLILGLGQHGGGFAAATYFADKGDEVLITDSAERSKFGAIPEILEKRGVCCKFGSQTKEDIQSADIVIKNPAIPATSPLLSYAKVIETDISLLFKHPEIKHVKIIAVTGTKGKTTTVSAINDALTKAGKDCFLCGNIGISGFFAIKEIEKRKREGRPIFEYLIAELSSWQIHDAYISLGGKWPKFELIVLTNIFPDHQNTYTSLSNYSNDKIRLLSGKANYRLVPRNKAVLIKTQINTNRFPITVFPSLTNPYKTHMTQLIPAYEALRRLGFSKSHATQLLNTYKGTPHRCEQVGLKNNIMFINDSAATIAEAVNFTLSNVAPLSYHLICGGTDKNLPADKMAKALKGASSITLLNGSFTLQKLLPLINKLKLHSYGPFNSMKEAFDVSYYFAKEAEARTHQLQVVILSPGAASFELFTNEFARGNSFKKEVNEILNGPSKT